MTIDPNNIPKCPHCGIYLLIGMLNMRVAEQLKAEYGWKIGRLDHGVPKKELDACVVGCVCHSCPRCKTELDAYFDEVIPSRRAECDRKTRIQQHAVLANYPSRYDAKFTNDNDHNPTIREECSRCKGLGQVISVPIDENNISHCPDCDGLGYTGSVVKYFANDETILTVPQNQHGWVRCPFCKWRFLPTDKKAWTGLRHKRCGQKLQITNTDEPEQTNESEVS